MAYTVYLIECSKTSKVYVGQTTKPTHQRLAGHVSDAYRRPERSKLWAAIRKYGPKCFTIRAIEECSSRSEMNERETFWIETLDSIHKGYNIAAGGGARCWTEEQKRRFSENHPLRGVTGPGHPAYGYRHTEEAKTRIAAASRLQTGRVFSDDHRAKISASQVGRTWTEKMGEERASLLSKQASDRMILRHSLVREPDSVVKCVSCGEHFTKTAKQIKRSKIHCCSKKCVGAYSARVRAEQRENGHLHEN